MAMKGLLGAYLATLEIMQLKQHQLPYNKYRRLVLATVERGEAA
jgi:hypothetical protein